MDYELVLVCYNSRTQISELLKGLPETVPLAVVDNARGADGLPELIEGRPNSRYLDGGGQGYARAANLGALSSSYEVVIFVDPDSRPTKEVLDALAADVLRDDRCASSAASAVQADGLFGYVGGWEPTLARAAAHAVGAHKLAPKAGMFARLRPGESVAVDWTGGACTAVRRSLFEALGGFDERYFVYSEDVAFGRTVREHGLYQRLRTDLVVPHATTASGGSSPEMLCMRGASMAQYLRAHHSPVGARMIGGTLAAGYLVRALEQRLRGDSGLATEYLAYVRGIRTGRAYVGGLEVAEMAARRPPAPDARGREDSGKAAVRGRSDGGAAQH